MKLEKHKEKQIELKLGNDGSFYYSGDLDHSAVVELVCIAQSTARSYQRQQQQYRQDPIAVSVCLGSLLAGFWLLSSVILRPAPNPQIFYQPQTSQVQGLQP